MSTRSGATNEGGRAFPITSRNKIGRFVTGITVLVLGALVVADAVTSTVAGTPFIFTDGLNRGFEFVVGLITIALASSVMDESRR